MSIHFYVLANTVEHFVLLPVNNCSNTFSQLSPPGDGNAHLLLLSSTIFFTITVDKYDVVAGIAQLVEFLVANETVMGSGPVSRSRDQTSTYSSS